MQQSHCEMVDTDEVSISTSASVQSHKMSRVFGPSTDGSSVNMDTDQAAASNQSFCCDSDCASNCDIGIAASLVMQISAYSPVFINASSSLGFSSDVLVRGLTPPSRPPANFS